MKIYLAFQLKLIIICSFFLFGCKKSIQNKEILNIKEYFIYCDVLDLDNMNNNYKSNDYIPILFQEGNQKSSAKMRIRGDSSREYNKKSLKIKIASMSAI